MTYCQVEDENRLLGFSVDHVIVGEIEAFLSRWLGTSLVEMEEIESSDIFQPVRGQSSNLRIQIAGTSPDGRPVHFEANFNGSGVHGIIRLKLAQEKLAQSRYFAVWALVNEAHGAPMDVLFTLTCSSAPVRRKDGEPVWEYSERMLIWPRSGA